MKTKSTLTIFLLASLLVITTVSCTIIGNCVEGEGKVVTRELTLEPFHNIELSGSSRVFLTKANKQKVSIKAPENIIALLNKNVESEEWEIHFKKCIKTSQKIEIYIELPSVEELEVHGSGDIIGKSQFEGEELDLEIAGSGSIELDFVVEELESEIAGSGDLKLSGTTKSHKIEINGSGDIDAFDLVSYETDVDINGSGDVKINVSDELKVDVNGSGDVFYKGGASKVSSDINGSGKLHQEN